MRRIVLFITFMVLSLSTRAGVENINGLYYLLIESSHIAEVNYTLGETYKDDIVIPEYVTFNGERYDVRMIGEKAFYDCTKVTSVSIPSSVFNIKDNAFSGCSGLTSISIPSSVTKIGTSVFSRCTGLTEIEIPNSVEELGGGAFKNCTSLKTVKLPDAITELNSIMFDTCTELESVVVPDNVSTIGNQVFNNCFKLKEVTFGSKVQSIGYLIFVRCDNLADVFCYAESVPKTDKQAFFSKANYSDVGPFSYAVKYTSLHVPRASVQEYKNANGWKEFMLIDAIEGNAYYLNYYVDGELYKSCLVNEGENIVAESDPVKEGFVFSGWSEMPETMPKHDVEVNGTWLLGQCATPTISYASGKLKFTCETEGVEYVYHVGEPDDCVSHNGEVKLNSLKVSVYARKQDYKNSDVVTAEFDVRSPIGDVNGDGKIDAVDITCLVDILLNR